MDIALYFANTESLFDVEEALQNLNLRDIPSFISATLLWDNPSAREYFGNPIALETLEQLQADGHTISRLYFGQEFCEQLIPSADDLARAHSFARQLEWDFTYVTGYVTDAGLAKVKQNLSRLLDIDDCAEVVVNDWGVLRLLSREFPSLKPVLGRLLVKQKRLCRYTSTLHLPPVNLRGLSSDEGKIRDNQFPALAALSIAGEEYRAELHRLGVRRVDLDIVPQAVVIRPDEWALSFSCYFPWAYVSGGRNCLTAASVAPRRRYVVLDKPCPRPCRTINHAVPLLDYPESTVQRGNSVFVFTKEYAGMYLDGTIPVDRVVFEPYIPI